jgi:hypothetical protein
MVSLPNVGICLYLGFCCKIEQNMVESLTGGPFQHKDALDFVIQGFVEDG